MAGSARRPRVPSQLSPRLTVPLAYLVILSVFLASCSPELFLEPAEVAESKGSALSTQTATPLALVVVSTPAIGVPSPTLVPTAAPARPTTAPTAAARAGTAARTTVATEVYRMNSASVVNITSLATVRTSQGTSQEQGIGSGFTLDDQGYIVTNNHVVENSTELTVTFADGTSVPAQLVGRDPDNDLAVVKVDPALEADGKTVRSLIKPVKLGDSSKLVVGEDVVAIGSPLGLQQTVTTGIVSALRAPGEEVAQGELLLLGGAVQTDASINPGNSGGPLFNYLGEVIGVNTWGLSPSGGSIGLGFAIPVNVVKRVAPQLIQRGCVKHPLVGIRAFPLSRIGETARRQYSIPTGQKGILVQIASDGSALAGIRAGTRAVTIGGEQVRVGGDIITAIDGQPTNTGGDLRAYVENSKSPGDSVTISLVRDGQRLEVKVTLGTRDSEVPCR